MIESLSLEPFVSNLPQEISIGVRKRVGLARALITEPKVLLFDEPNTGLDPLVGQEVYDLIKECREKWGFTGVVISHELPEVFQVSDKVAMLLKGKVIEEGTPQDLISSSNPAVQQFLNGRIDGPIKIQ
jgi:phospholipid/cholesterol/gamma-HCH transport system ATP-binding protein